MSSKRSVPSPLGESPSESERLVEEHGLDRITKQDAALHAILQASNTKIHKLVLGALKELDALPLEDAAKIAASLTKALKTHYELLDLKGRIHEKDDRRGKIIARVGIRQTAEGTEAVAEVTVP